MPLVGRNKQSVNTVQMCFNPAEYFGEFDGELLNLCGWLTTEEDSLINTSNWSLPRRYLCQGMFFFLFPAALLSLLQRVKKLTVLSNGKYSP